MPTLYGPTGERLGVYSSRTERDQATTAYRDVVKQLDGLGINVDQVVDGEVGKRVRSQAASLSQVWDPRRGKPKPTSITYDTLRMMARRNEWCAAIIKTRKNQIGKVPWTIKPRDDDDTTPATKKLCKQVTKLLERPSLHGSRPNSRSWRQFIGEVLGDILELDAGVIEKERNGRKWICAMYPVDGGTIQPNIDDRGGYHDDAYVQIVEGQVTARFGMEDLVYIMDNPQTDVRFSGYGFSPLENLIVSVTAELYASKYNSSYFEKGAVPEGMINLGEEVSPEDVDAFRLYWMNEIMGKPWALPIIGGKGAEWIPWRASNKDMEYMEYQKWLQQKMCAVYQIPPQEVGQIEDVNRSTAEEQSQSNQTKSILPILTLIEDYFEVEIIGDHGLGVSDYIKFEFDKEDDEEAQTDQAFSIRVENGVATRNEWREAVGMEPMEDEGADMLLVAGQLQGLPTQQDVDLSSATGQQQQQQDQMDQQAKLQQEQGSGPGTMPWKPANPGDQDFQQAKGQYDQGSAMGPKQIPVGKTFLDGKRLVQNAAGHTIGHTLHSSLTGQWEAHHVDHGFLGEHPTNSAARSAVIAAHKRGVGKSVPYDRNPALTREQDRLEDVFDRKNPELLSTLSRILGIPLDEAEELTTT